MLTLHEIAVMYAVDDATVRRWIRNGDLIAFRLGAVTRIAEEEEAAFRERHLWRRGTTAPARSAGASSSAETGNTSTGERSYRQGLSEAVASIRTARSESQEHGSATKSRVVSVDFRQKETA